MSVGFDFACRFCPGRAAGSGDTMSKPDRRRRLPRPSTRVTGAYRHQPIAFQPHDRQDGTGTAVHARSHAPSSTGGAAFASTLERARGGCPRFRPGRICPRRQPRPEHAQPRRDRGRVRRPQGGRLHGRDRDRHARRHGDHGDRRARFAPDAARRDADRRRRFPARTSSILPFASPPPRRFPIPRKSVASRRSAPASSSL